MEKKYELLEDDTIEVCEHVLYRIRAVKDFDTIKSGDLGGYIEKEENLSHEGNCWVYDNAKVIDCALISNDAKIKHNAIISEHAIVRDYAEVSGCAIVHGDAKISDNAVVTHSAQVFGRVIVGDNALVCGNAIVSGAAIIIDYGKIYDDAIINGNTIINHEVSIGHHGYIISDSMYKCKQYKNKYGKYESVTCYNTSNGGLMVSAFNKFNCTLDDLLNNRVEHDITNVRSLLIESNDKKLLRGIIL